MQQDDQPPLTAEEIRALRKLVPHADLIGDDAEYAAAQALVFRRWRGAVLAAATLIAAGMLIWEHGRKTLQGLGHFLSGGG